MFVRTDLPFETMFKQYRWLYRDSKLRDDLLASYRPGMLIREPAFCDATHHFGGFAAPHRYLIYAGTFPCIAGLSEHPEWGLCVGPLGTFFKVLGVDREGDLSQIALLEIPEDIVNEFVDESLGPVEQVIATDAADRFRRALSERPRPEHMKRLWLDRVAHPLGLREDGVFYDLENPWGAALAELVAAGVVHGPTTLRR